MSARPQPVDRLVFKGTHNSYACRDQSPPFMNHSPRVQIDDFGVWLLELDFGIVEDGRLMIGHDRAGDGACSAPADIGWPQGLELQTWLEHIRNSAALRYRPLFLHLDPKDFEELPVALERVLDMGIQLVKRVFTDRVMLSTDIKRSDGSLRSVPELAGMVVLPFIPDSALDPNAYEDGCTDWQIVEAAIDHGTGLEQDCAGGCRLLRLDQYQADWTFEYGVPPNPIMVEPDAPRITVVADSTGDAWGCPGGPSPTDVWRGQQVGRHGTFRFPFGTLGEAVQRAEGTTERGRADPRRSGYGWTVLLGTGRYRERIRITIPLTLANAEPAHGRVSVG